MVARSIIWLLLLLTIESIGITAALEDTTANNSIISSVSSFGVSPALHLGYLRNETLSSTSLNHSRITITIGESEVEPSSILELENIKKLVPANQILLEIEKGKTIEYNNVIIDGDLDLNKLTLQKQYFPRTDDERYVLGLNKSLRFVNSSIKIKNSIINGSVLFNDTIFREPLIFSGTEFNKSVIFDGSIMQNYINFNGAEFNDLCSFLDVTFNDHSDFSAKFGIKKENTSKSPYSRLHVYKYTYRYDSDFSYSKFNKGCSFKSAIFEDDIGFKQASFLKSVDFSYALFNRTPHFWWAIFSGEVDFTNAKFMENLDLSDSQFNLIRIRWDDIKDKLNYDNAVFLGLIRSFKSLGYFDDANNCYFQYRWESQFQNQGSSALLDILAWVSCGYGVRWYHTILSALGITIVFGIYLAISEGILKLKYSEAIIKLRDLLFFSFIVLISAPMEWYWQKYSKEGYELLTRRYTYLIILERLIGWSLLILLIGVLSRLMIY